MRNLKIVNRIDNIFIDTDNINDIETAEQLREEYQNVFGNNWDLAIQN